MSIRSIVTHYLTDIAASDANLTTTYIAPQIPDKKLNNAIKAISFNSDPREILGIIDTTLFHNGKGGAYFTNHSLYFKPMLESAVSFNYTDIISVELGTTNDEKPKPQLCLLLTDDRNYIIDNDFTSNIDPNAFVHLMSEIISDVHFTTQENSQTENGKDNVNDNNHAIYSLEDLPDNIKLDYVKLLCSFAFQDDQNIDLNEYRSIVSLAARIKLGQEQQFKLNQFMVDQEISDSSDLLENLSDNVNSDTREILNPSIMKDVLSMYSQKDGANLQEWHNNPYLVALANELDLQNDDVELLITTINHDQDILAKRLNDTEIKKQTKDLMWA